MKRIISSVVLFGIFSLRSIAQDANNSSSPSHGISEKAVKSMLPPQLSYPANESVIDVQYPVLIWIPPMPVNGMLVTYSLKLVEILKGQSLAEALFQNPPLIELSGLSNTFLNYPVDATPLRTDAYYGWQVSASSGGQNLGVTDMWSFTLKKDNDKKDDNVEYPVATKVAKERFYLTDGVFHFVYNNVANEMTLSYTIKSMTTTKEISGLPVIKLKPGMNKLKIDLQQSGMLKKGTYYNLQIRDSRQQLYKITYYYLPS